jgi:two-component system OmpR family response regulator
MNSAIAEPEGRLASREANHRFLNTLTALHGLLRTDFGEFVDPAVREAVSVFSSRIQAFACVHRTLSDESGDDLVDAPTHLARLCAELCAAHLAPRGLHCDFAADPGTLPREVCQKLGLIIVELVTNAAKHAFGRTDGRADQRRPAARRARMDLPGGRRRLRPAGRRQGRRDDPGSRAGAGAGRRAAHPLRPWRRGRDPEPARPVPHATGPDGQRLMAVLAAQASRLLLVDSDRAAATLLARRLAAAGHSVDHAHSWREGLSRAVSDDYHLILLDLALPEIDGPALTRILRAGGLAVPVLMLCDNDNAATRPEALVAGADDLLARPFTDSALLARVAALARPPPARDPPTVLRVADLELDLALRTVARAGRPIRLGAHDFDLLAYLMASPGRAVTRDALQEAVWGRRCDPRTRRVDAGIERIRAEVDRGSAAKLIHLVPGVGYCLLDED